MQVKCINDHVITNGLTKGNIYDVISVEYGAGPLYRIIDDNGDNKRYADTFFKILNR
jgi:hypothetical protein